jgi:hypothetical protein
MDEKKEKETQAELESSANSDPVSDEQETDQDLESLDGTQKESESETSKISLETSNDSPEDESESETVGGIKTDQKLSEIEAADQKTEEAPETAEAFKGEAGEKSDAPVSDDELDGGDTATPHEVDQSDHEADQSDDDRQIADGESKETDSPAASESDDENLSDDDEAEPMEEGRETQLSEEDSDDKGEDDNLTNVESDDTSEPPASNTSIKEEDQDSAEEKQDDTADDNAPKDQAEQQPNDAEEETKDLPELESKKKIPLVKAALTVIMVVAVFSGFFILDNKSNIKSAQKAKSKEVENAVASKASYKKTKPTIQPDDPNYVYHVKIKEISTLRETLLRKKEEIRQLKNHYQQGNEELEKEIFDEMRSTNSNTFLQALANNRIEFGLRTIQRRHAYIRQLDRPSGWIYRACEELLFLKRRTMVDLRVAEIASGIDMSMHMRHMNAAIEKYRPTADRLAVDMTNAQLEPLENVWEQIQTRNLQTSNDHAVSKNQVISEEVCSGTFKRVTEFSEISVEAAKCIAEMPGSDLFLNDLSEISPRAAKYLFQWKGSWLCLNGFRALSPRVANYLFQWEGGWISLNGLTEFPAEIGQILLQWQGKQLELMGLRYSENSFDKIGVEYLVQWEHSGGKLFVPQDLREKIDKLKGDSV